MSGSIKFCSLVLFLTTAVKCAESALAFNSTPDNPTYVVEGQNIVLAWEYTVGNRQSELNGIVWSVTDAANLDIPLIYEDKAGKRHISSRILSAYKGRVNVTKRATLIIQNATLNDSRSFNCFLSATAGSGASNQRSSVRVIVTVPPTVIVVPPRVRYANVGDPASITCNATGIPTPNITWYRDGQQVSGSRYQVVKTAESSQLTIKSVSNADHGHYVCRASSNGMEPAETRYFLGVTALLEDLLEDSSLPVSYKAKEGDTAVLNCPVISHPAPEVRWTFKGETFINVKTFSTVHVIPYVNESSFGSYICTATSLEGTIKTFNISLESSEPAIIVKGKRSLNPGDVLEWDKVEGAWIYFVRLYENEYLNASYDSVGKKTFREILYNKLVFKSENADSRPNPVDVTIDVFAMGKNSILEQNRFFVEIFDSATTATVSLLTLILSLMVHYLQ